MNILHSILVLLLVHNAVGQAMYTREERDRILEKHRRELEKQTEQIFQHDSNRNRPVGVYDTANYKAIRDYEGQYATVSLGNHTHWTTACGKEFSGNETLIGIDYKRHLSRHFLLCHSHHILVLRTFVIEKGQRLGFRQSTTLNYAGAQEIRQALLFHNFQNGQLLIALHMRRGHVSVLTTLKLHDKESGTFSLLESDAVHQFELYERVVRIEVSHLMDVHKFVVLLDGYPSYAQYDKKSHNLIRVQIPRANNLETFNVLTQSFIAASNSSQFHIFRVHPTKLETVAHYGYRGRIIDLHPLIYGPNHYLLVAGDQRQALYLFDETTSAWKGSAYISKKGIRDSGLLSCSYHREDLFFWIDSGTQVFTYTYDYEKQNFVIKLTHNRNSIIEASFIPGRSCHFSEKDRTYEFKISEDGELWFFGHDVVLDGGGFSKRDPIWELHQVVGSKLSGMQNAIVKLKNTETISKKETTMKFDFAVKFNRKVITKNLVSHAPTPPKQWRVQNISMEFEDLYTDLNELGAFVHKNIRPHLGSIEKTINHRVVYKSRDAIFRETPEFVSQVQAPLINANLSSSIDIHNGYPVLDVLSNLYRSSINPPLLGRKYFTSNVFVGAALEIGLLNQRPLDSYLFTDLEQDIYSPLWYSSLDVNNLRILGPINANLSLENVVFINQHRITPIKLSTRTMFEHLSVDNLHVNRLDNVDVRSLSDQVLRRHSDKLQVFRIPTRFGSLNLARAFDTNFVNGHTSKWLFSNLAFRSGKNIFQAPLHIKGDLSLNTLECPSVNDVRIPIDLLDRFSDQIVNGHKHFKSAKFNSINAERFNDLRLPEDVYIASMDEFVPGSVTMDRLVTDGHLQLGGLIDGVNLTHSDQRYISSLQNHYRSLLFRQKVTVEDLHVSGFTDGFKLHEVYHDAVFADSSKVEIVGPKRISTIFSARDLRVLGLINGRKLEQFARTDEELFFEAPVSFASGQFRNVSIRGLLDGVPASNLAGRISSLRNKQPIYGSKVFKNILQVDNLYVGGRINGQFSNNFMLYNVQQNVTGKVYFSDVSIGRMQTNSNVRIQETLNDHNVKRFMDSLVFMDRIEPLQMDVHCSNCSIGNMHVDFINGRNFTNFLQNYLSKSRPQKIAAPKLFVAPQHFVHVNTTNGMAGIDVRRINDEVITLKGHNIVRNEVIFQRDVILRGPAKLYSEFFNGQSFKKFLHNAVYVNSSAETIVHGSVKFNNGLHVQNQFHVQTLNGIDPHLMFFTKTGNHSIRSRIVFHEDVHSGSALEVQGLINKIDFHQLAYNALKQDHSGKLLGNINFEGPMRVDHIRVDGLVDGLPLNRNSILFRNSEQDISTLIINGQTHFRNGLEVLSSLNNFESSVLEHIVFARGTSSQQNIKSSKTFGSIHTPVLVHRQGSLALPIINGHDLARFEQLAVYSLVNRTIPVTKHFNDNVTFLNPAHIHGLFNGINLDNDIIKLNSINAQKITGRKEFERINLRGSVDLHGNVNGINLTSLSFAVLQDHGRQYIKTNMVFYSPLYLHSDSEVDFLNSIPPKQYLTLDRDHIVAGNLHFEHATVNRVQAKLINDVNIDEVAPHLLYSRANDTQNVKGYMTVKNFVLDKNLETEENINGIDLEVAVEKATKNIRSSFNIVEMKRDIEHQTNRIRSRAEMFEFANFEIEHLSHAIVNEAELQHAQWYQPKELKRRFLVQDKLFETSLTEHPQGSKVYSIHLVEPNGVRTTFYVEAVVSHVSQVRSFVREGYIYLVFGVSGQNHNSTQSWLKRVPFARPRAPAETVQIFDERDVTALEFFADPYGAHYLVFNSLTNTGRSLHVYQANSLPDSRFELMQTLPPLDGLTLFSFGHGSTFRQFYLVGIQEFDTFVLYRHDGVFGFETKWTIRSPALSPNSLSHPVIPLIVGRSKLYFHIQGCDPKTMVQAILNGALEDVQF